MTVCVCHSLKIDQLAENFWKKLSNRPEACYSNRTWNKIGRNKIGCKRKGARKYCSGQKKIFEKKKTFSGAT